MMREMLATNRQLAAKLNELENRADNADSTILELIRAIRKLMAPARKRQRRTGFQLPAAKRTA
jgi:hypothetical protein